MENVIGEHFDEIENFRTFALIFTVEIPFTKSINHIHLFKTDVFVLEKEFEFYTGIFFNQKKEGFWIYWHSNGRKLEEGNYVEGKENGLWISWHSNGRKASEGNYVNGRTKGLWILWDRRNQRTERFFNL